jgi:DNA helicase-2/ATP-dependent DNA helicase PcrA
MSRYRYAAEYGQEILFQAEPAQGIHSQGIHSQGTGSGVKGEIEHFTGIIEFFKGELLKKNPPKGWRLSEKVRALVDNIDYWAYLVTEYSKNEKIAKWKFLNIETLINSIENWEKDPDNLDPTLYPYLNRVSLITRDDGDDADKGKVNLMTIHASKGLEFPVVFIAGAEDGIIPHAKSLEEGEERAGLQRAHGTGGLNEDLNPMEEERRLFYVAITRARDKLYITSCLKRRKLQNTEDCVPSPFLAEIPPQLLEYHETEEIASEEEAVDYFAAIKNRFTGSS